MKEILRKFAERVIEELCKDKTVERKSIDVLYEEFCSFELPELMAERVSDVLSREVETTSVEKALSLALFYAGQNFGLETRVKGLENKIADKNFDFCCIGGCEEVGPTCWKDCPNSRYNRYAAQKIEEQNRDLIDFVMVELDTKVTAQGMISIEQVEAILKEKLKESIKSYKEGQVDENDSANKIIAKELLQELYNEAIEYGRTTTGIEHVADKFNIKLDKVVK